MSDLEKYIQKRKQTDAAFANQYDAGYQIFKEQESNFDDFLKQENLYDEIDNIAKMRVFDYNKKLER